jgi:hypothetical protein
MGNNMTTPTHRRSGSHDHEYDVRLTQHTSAQVCSGFAFRFNSRQVTGHTRSSTIHIAMIMNQCV